MTYFEFLKIVSKNGRNVDWTLNRAIEIGNNIGNNIFSRFKDNTAWLAVDFGTLPEYEITDTEIDEWVAVKEVFENYHKQ